MAGAVINPIRVRGLESTDPITMSGDGKVKLMRRLPLETFRKGAAFAPTETILRIWILDAENNILLDVYNLGPIEAGKSYIYDCATGELT